LKTVFDAVGGFDERLIVDEDRELGLRLTRQGYTVFYTPRIVVRHGHARNNLGKIVTHQYRWGRLIGLVNEQKYRRERGLWFLPLIQRPLVYLSILPGLCLALTLRIIRRNWRERPQVVGYAPFIFLAKMAYRLGVVAWLWRDGETRETT
jgi:GT2 family glycosyltransferase